MQPEKRLQNLVSWLESLCTQLRQTVTFDPACKCLTLRNAMRTQSKYGFLDACVANGGVLVLWLLD